MRGPKKYLRVSEVAGILGVSRRTVYNWIKRGEIRSIKTIGGHYRVHRVEVFKILRALKRKSKEYYVNIE